jgi:hypothetical protein
MPHHFEKPGLEGFPLIDTFSKLSNYRTANQVHVTPTFHDFGTSEDLFSSAHFQNSRTADCLTIASYSFETSMISSHQNFFKIAELSIVEPLGKSNGSPPPE